MSNKYKRLEGLKEALKEGFEHTNKARVEMSPDEELMKKEARKMSPVSDRDIKILEDKAKKSAKDPERPKFKEEDFADV